MESRGEQELLDPGEEGTSIPGLMTQEEADAIPEEPGGWVESYDIDEEMAHIYDGSNDVRRFSE